ncbi:unnamed protein product [Trifolium pratense]|uniref:Uncharacterized protein n=1 Tax=Trifolium pratense TaxID=57577 RepID=A0ACB0IXF6_TRIPR|nr:unnamed protein product [Trifolium pratense]
MNNDEFIFFIPTFFRIRSTLTPALKLRSNKFHSCGRGRAYLFSKVRRLLHLAGNQDCLWCVDKAESCIHLLLHCNFAQKVWREVGVWLNLDVIIPPNLFILFLVFHGGLFLAPALCSLCISCTQVIAHEKSEKFKEGEFVLERWRIVDDVEDELNLDAHASSSDTENT